MPNCTQFIDRLQSRYKGVERNAIIGAFESAVQKEWNRKKNEEGLLQISVDRITLDINVLATKTVVLRVENPFFEIGLKEARPNFPNVREGDVINVHPTSTYSALDYDAVIASIRKRLDEDKTIVQRKEPEEPPKPPPVRRIARKHLDCFIGMGEVKEQMGRLEKVLMVQGERKKRGMKGLGRSNHLLFAGPPGTGKTSMARVVGKIYKELGILSKGHVVETDRLGLVGQYIGETAIKTDELISKARGGVLFIDEAYALTPKDSPRDTGAEAIATLLKRMEDYRDDFVVIAAGYQSEMERFVQSNPGLQSRFSTYFTFRNYSPEELWKIFVCMAGENQYQVAPEAKEAAVELFEKAIHEQSEQFGNGRFVRNVLERTIEEHAVRVSEILNPSRRDLSRIIANDLCEPSKLEM